MRADLLAFPPTRIIRHRMKPKTRVPNLTAAEARIAAALEKSNARLDELMQRDSRVVQTKRSPALIAWAGFIMLVRYTVPAAVYVLAGGTVFRWLGLL